MQTVQHLQPCQIVYLEVDGDRLYTEIIQIVPSRGLAWVRPLVLVKSDGQQASHPQAVPEYYDLRQGADLLWPLHGFHPALDTEIIPIFALLGEMHPIFPKGNQHHHHLRNFINRLWSIDLQRENS